MRYGLLLGLVGGFVRGREGGAVCGGGNAGRGVVFLRVFCVAAFAEIMNNQPLYLLDKHSRVSICAIIIKFAFWNCCISSV